MRTVLCRRLGPVGSVLLTAAAAVGTMCLLLTVIAPLAGVRPLIFLSGSMSPTIPAGSLALARTVDAEDIAVNDIITVPSNGTYLTHRVVEVTHRPGEATLLMRGDGNKTVDSTLYDVSSAPRTELWVPHAGSVVAWFSHAPGVYVLAAWVAVVIGSLRRRRPDERTSGPRARPGPPKLALELGRFLRRVRSRGLVHGPQLARGAVATAVFVTTPMVAAPPATAAAWADTVGVSGTTIGTVTPTPPVASCGAGGVSSQTISWTPRAGATAYELTYGGVGDPTVEMVPGSQTSKTFTSGGGKFAVKAVFGSPSWISTSSNQLSYSAQGQSTCA